MRFLSHWVMFCICCTHLNFKTFEANLIIKYVFAEPLGALSETYKRRIERGEGHPKIPDLSPGKASSKINESGYKQQICCSGWLANWQDCQKIVNQSPRNLRGPPSEPRTLVLEKDLCEWNTYFFSDSIIASTSDEELFSYLEVKKYKFATLKDKESFTKPRISPDELPVSYYAHSPCHATESAFVQGNTSTWGSPHASSP